MAGELEVRRRASLARAHLDDTVFALRTLWAAGILAPERPDRALRAMLALRRWGASPAAGYVVQGARASQTPAILDELGVMTFGEGDTRTNAIARGLRANGIGEGENAAILCRNHRGFVEATIAISKLGANAICMNTGFAGPQIAEVCAREGLTTLIYDEEFSEAIAEAAESRRCFLARHEGSPAHETLDDLANGNSRKSLRPPSAVGRIERS